jgi:hypothetical protein
MTLTNGWMEARCCLAVLGEFQYYKTADEEVELKNIRTGSCRRVNINKAWH